MRCLLAFVLLAGCYDPTIPSGALKCGVGGACPSGFRCDPSTQKCVQGAIVPMPDLACGDLNCAGALWGGICLLSSPNQSVSQCGCLSDGDCASAGYGSRCINGLCGCSDLNDCRSQAAIAPTCQDNGAPPIKICVCHFDQDCPENRHCGLGACL